MNGIDRWERGMYRTAYETTIPPEDIRWACATACGISVGEMMGNFRHNKITMARRMTAWFCRRLLGKSYQEMAEACGLGSHSSLVTGVSRIRDMEHDHPEQFAQYQQAAVDAVLILENGVMGKQAAWSGGYPSIGEMMGTLGGKVGALPTIIPDKKTEDPVWEADFNGNMIDPNWKWH